MLKNEIIALGMPLDDHGAIAEALSANRIKVGNVSRADFAMWCAVTGTRAKLEDISENQAHPLRSAALACKDVLLGAADGIDLSKQDNQMMLQAFVIHGVITQPQADELISLASHPDPVTSQEVTKALEGN